MMSRWTRRSFLGAALAGTAGSLLPGELAWNASAAPRGQYVVNIFLWGGLDAVLTVDPKDATLPGSQIEPGYHPEERRQGALRLYGPLMGELVRHDSDLCLVHGVRTDTVAHPTGELIVQRGRVKAPASAPWLGDMLGDALPGDAPIRHLSLGQSSASFEPEDFPQRVIVPPELAQGLFDERARAARVEPWLLAHGGRETPLGRLLSTAERSPRFQDPFLGPQLQLALHALQGDFARAVTVSTRPLHLDAHQEHLALQRSRLAPALDDIARFIDALKSVRTPRGRLFDQTTIAIGSEFGRAPRYDRSLGKEHWPETSWVLAGRGIRGGTTVGETGLDLRGLTIDYRTGRPTGDQRRPVLIDALSATLLRITSPDSLGHGLREDDVLECALAEPSGDWRPALS
jgi:hypothetical protein